MLIHSGCVSVTPDERFPDVARAIDERAGQRVQWRLGGPEDDRADTFVADLLSRPLTADAAVQVALLRSRDLQAVYEDLGIAQADLVHAGLLRNPDLAGFFRFPDSGPRAVNWNIGLDFWLDIFVVPLRKRIAGTELDAAILRVTGAVLHKATAVRKAYAQHRADLVVLEQQRALAEFAQVAAELMSRQSNLGNVSELDRARQSALTEAAMLELDRAESAAAISREELRRLLELTAEDTRWSIEGTGSLKEFARGLPPADAEAEPLVAAALEKRVDLALLAREVELLRLGLEMDRKWFLAKGSVGVETEGSSDGVQATGPHFNVELPIFHQHQALYARREAQTRQAENRLAAARGAARAEVRIAAQRMALARRSAERYEAALLPARRRVSALTQAEYNSMIVGVFNLLAVKEEETRTAIEYARVTNDYWTARADLERAIGVRLPDLPAATPPQETPPPAQAPPQPAPPSQIADPHAGHRSR
jgi:outer membrane protein, heavy metal efflux system